MTLPVADRIARSFHLRTSRSRMPEPRTGSAALACRSPIRADAFHPVASHFPKSLLKQRDYETGEINEIANMAFITGQTNRRISTGADCISSSDCESSRMDVEQGYVSRLETGDRNPTIATIDQRAKALRIRPALLFEAPAQSVRKKIAKRCRRSAAG